MPLTELCKLPAFEIDQTLCIGDLENAVANRSHFGADLTGFEAFVNHIHLADELAGTPARSIDELQVDARVVSRFRIQD
jgi:hypothetical protein